MAVVQPRTDRPGPRAVVPQRQLRAAIAAGDLDVHYQPIVDLTTGGIAGVEALLRLRSATGGPTLLPDDFLPAVAHAPVMHDVTRWVIDRVCLDAAQLPPCAISVNVAAVDVVRPSLVACVREALERHGVEPHRLTIELTEHAAVQGMSRAVEVLGQLRDLGVTLSLDDFGTGYSSLLYLRDLPLSQVKIDRAFTSGCGENDDDDAIVCSVIQLAHRVGLEVVAEGVEHERQLRFLRAARCNLAQGFLLARPAPLDEVPQSVASPVLSERRTRRRRPLRVSAEVPGSAQAVIQDLATQGASLHTIAAALNQQGMQTPVGTRWTAATVARVMSGF